MGKRIIISKGNSKMGKIASLSLPPCRTCDHALPCYMGSCYGKKLYRLRPTVKHAWDSNWDLLTAGETKAEYFRKISEYLSRHQPALFRWHTAGDIPDSDYLARMFAIAKMYPDTKFLAFTKKYNLMESKLKGRWLTRWRNETPNLRIVISVWPYLPVPPKLLKKFPAAYMRDPRDPDPRIPFCVSECSGSCDTCGKCWNLANGASVVFNKH